MGGVEHLRETKGRREGGGEVRSRFDSVRNEDNETGVSEACWLERLYMRSISHLLPRLEAKQGGLDRRKDETSPTSSSHPPLTFRRLPFSLPFYTSPSSRALPAAYMRSLLYSPLPRILCTKRAPSFLPRSLVQLHHLLSLSLPSFHTDSGSTHRLVLLFFLNLSLPPRCCC
ncbi:hypothetical protein BDY24DRAFT_226167 [Mrakia frigida]|uniref:uncharacterized protein n=1 Tax=Mrakia frigida TaxID=29902 RepID=UPI003FCC0D20